ncbi:MAG: polyphenol oxidase family protein [Acidimicrobiia bacterium]
MIRPPETNGVVPLSGVAQLNGVALENGVALVSGVAFTDAKDGDMLTDPLARVGVSARLDIPTAWATVRQVHGARVVEVDTPGDHGPADAMWTTRLDLPLAVLTADCLGVVLKSDDAVGVAHAGWRGAESGIVGRLRDEMGRSSEPTRAWVGPGVGVCCFEVGEDVSSLFPTHLGETTWGSVSVDLLAVIRAQLRGLEVWTAGMCTMHQPGYFSHRRDRTPARMAALGWL